MNETSLSAKHYDMVVVGSGAAGHHGAIQAAKLGKKVAVVKRSILLVGPVSTLARFRARHFGRLSRVLPDRGPRIAGSRPQSWH
jgi:heterodisulfide reductase subunit A-like polyferredoxin